MPHCCKSTELAVKLTYSQSFLFALPGRPAARLCPPVALVVIVMILCLKSAELSLVLRVEVTSAEASEACKAELLAQLLPEMHEQNLMGTVVPRLEQCLGWSAFMFGQD